jgi:hypothetical protein
MNDIVMILRRFEYGEKETLGWLYVMDNKTTLGVFSTLERAWLNNAKNLSCIPTGRYVCTRRNPTQKFNYEHLLINGVPNRDAILMHIGNIFTNSSGCVLVGTDFSDINGDGITDITESRKAFTKLMNMLPKTGNIELYII